MDWRMSRERKFFDKIRAGSIRLTNMATKTLSRICPKALQNLTLCCRLANAKHHPTRPELTALMTDDRLELPLETVGAAKTLALVEAEEPWSMGKAELAWQREDTNSAPRRRQSRSRSRRPPSPPPACPSPPPACPSPPLKDSSGRPYNLRHSPYAGPAPSYWTRPQEQGAQRRRSRPPENRAAQPAPRRSSPSPERRQGASRRPRSRPAESRATQPTPTARYSPPPQRHRVPRRSFSRPPEDWHPRPPVPPVAPPPVWDSRPPMPPVPTGQQGRFPSYASRQSDHLYHVRRD